MAANFSIQFYCLRCGADFAAYTDTVQGALYAAAKPANRYGTVQRGKQLSCPKCRTIYPLRISDITVEHSGNVGAFDWVNHAVSPDGTIVSSVGP